VRFCLQGDDRGRHLQLALQHGERLRRRRQLSLLRPELRLATSLPRRAPAPRACRVAAAPPACTSRSFSDGENRRRVLGATLSTAAPFTPRLRCARSASMDLSRSRTGDAFGTWGSPFSARQYRDIQRDLSHATLVQGAAPPRPRTPRAPELAWRSVRRPSRPCSPRRATSRPATCRHDALSLGEGKSRRSSRGARLELGGEGRPSARRRCIRSTLKRPCWPSWLLRRWGGLRAYDASRYHQRR
jgi:hypothetical protein